MFQLIKNYVSTLTKEKVLEFANSKDIHLSDSELDFIYRFITRNYEALYVNPNIDFSKYKQYLSSENYDKIIKLINEYRAKYSNYLK